MTPERAGPLTYWHSGGSIERRLGPLTRQRAAELFDFYLAEALAALAAKEFTAAWFLARTAIEIADATIAAEAWRRSACARRVRLRGDF
jgi:hypothetical protein